MNRNHENVTNDQSKTFLSSEFRRQKRPRFNVLQRLFDRQYNQTPRFHPFVFNNKFHQNLVPNFSIERAEHPNCFLRKFTYDGKYLMAFSSDITCVKFYKYQGADAASQLLSQISSANNEYLSHDESNSEIRRQIFDCFFKRHHTIAVTTDGGQLSRECSLFTDNNRFLIVASMSPTSEATTSFHDRYQTNESIPITYRSMFEDYKFYSIDIEGGRVVDSIEFNTDRIQIANNHGLYLYENVFAILSLQHQIIYLYYILPDGKFIFNRRIGRFCSEEDRLLYENSLMQSVYRLQRKSIPVSHRPVAAFREIPFNSLKHRIITFLFKQAKSRCSIENSTKSLFQYYHNFDYLINLRMVKMQLLDREHLLIKYEQEYNLLAYNQYIINKYDLYNQTKLWNLFVVYNWKTTNIVNIYPQHSEKLLYAYENFCNYFRHPYGYYPCSLSDNQYANRTYKEFKKLIHDSRNGDHFETTRCILSLLPHHAQLLTPSPYLDLSLFSYDEKLIGSYEKPKNTSDIPIRFFNRHTGRISFRMHTGQAFLQQQQQQRFPPTINQLNFNFNINQINNNISNNNNTNNNININNVNTNPSHYSYYPHNHQHPNNRRLIAFIFHPTDPFIISVQRYNSQYLLHFHIRHFNPL